MSMTLLDTPPITTDRAAGAVTTKTQNWLAQMGLEDCDDPNAMILLEASTDLDELNSGVHHLSHKDLVAARGKVRHTITTARRALQAVIDENSAQRHHERHKLHYSGIAASTLGWIDPEMLPADLLAQVAAHLAETYDVELAIYEPEVGLP